MPKHRTPNVRPVELTGLVVALAAAVVLSLTYPSLVTFVCVGALLAVVGGLTFRLAEHRQATRNVWSNYRDLLAELQTTARVTTEAVEQSRQIVATVKQREQKRLAQPRRIGQVA